MLITDVNKNVIEMDVDLKDRNILQFINAGDQNSNRITKIAVHHNKKVILLNISEVISIHKERNICQIHLTDHNTYLSYKDLKLFAEILKDLGDFVQVNRSTIINLKHLKAYSKDAICFLQMINNSEFEVSRRKKTEVLGKIRIL